MQTASDMLPAADNNYTPQHAVCSLIPSCMCQGDGRMCDGLGACKTCQRQGSSMHLHHNKLEPTKLTLIKVMSVVSSMRARGLASSALRAG